MKTPNNNTNLELLPMLQQHQSLFTICFLQTQHFVSLFEHVSGSFQSLSTAPFLFVYFFESSFEPRQAHPHFDMLSSSQQNFVQLSRPFIFFLLNFEVNERFPDQFWHVQHRLLYSQLIQSSCTIKVTQNSLQFRELKYFRSANTILWKNVDNVKTLPFSTCCNSPVQTPRISDTKCDICQTLSIAVPFQCRRWTTYL